MRYQDIYISNTKKIMAMRQAPFSSYEEKCRYRRENTDILKEHVVPILDNIASANEEQIDFLIGFADALAKENLDANVRYRICNALVSYARLKGMTNLLIKELYMAGMAIFGMQNIVGAEEGQTFKWRMSLYFGEAAGYIRMYDDIEDVETRGYIHRSMGNLALGYSNNDDKGIAKKLELINRSIDVITDPVFREKTPQLPWDLYLYNSHQERSSLLSFIRTGHASVKLISCVMESAQFIYERQVENARKRGIPLEPQWIYRYQAALYHCGAISMDDFLKELENIYISVPNDDYSQQGMFANVYMPVIYADYIRRDEELKERKKPVMTTMGKRQMVYLKNVPIGKNSDRLFSYLRGILLIYIEYPDGMSFLDYALYTMETIGFDVYEHSKKVADISMLILNRLFLDNPERLYGVLDCRTCEEVMEKSDAIRNIMYTGCLLHDIGRSSMPALYGANNRSWLSEEDELHKRHPEFGRTILKVYPSASVYVDFAYGHHTWYDKSGGYPSDFDRASSKVLPLIDIICVADYIVRNCDITDNYLGEVAELDDTIERVKKYSGTQFAPDIARIAVSLKDEMRPFFNK